MNMKPRPLRDNSGGLLEGWPGGGIQLPGGLYIPMFRPAHPDESAAATVIANNKQPVYCKYCYCNVIPLVLREHFIPGRVTEMTICAQCGSGLTELIEAV